MLPDSNMLSNYISIATGTDYQGEIPTTVTIPSSSETDDGGIVTVLVTVSIGEEDYQNVLDSWMFVRGYIRKGVNKVLVVLKGGAGSGFHGHKGRPGEVGGSLPKGSSAVAKVREPSIVDVTNPETRERLRAELKKYAEEFGFPADKMIFINASGQKFVVGADNYQSAALFDPKTDTITFYSGSMDGVGNEEPGAMHFNRPIIAHEVMHYKFAIYEKFLHRQEAIIKKATDSMTEANPYLDNDGVTLRPEFKDQFWAYDIKDTYYQFKDQRNKLWDVPVSAYGSSYIDVARHATYGLATSSALTENLGEIAASTIENNFDYNNFDTNNKNYISQDWADLYNAINQGLYQHKLIPTYPQLVTPTYKWISRN